MRITWFIATQINGLSFARENLPPHYLEDLALDFQPVTGDAMDMRVAVGQREFADADNRELLALRREPDNQYDANAIRIDHRGYKLGYIPAVQAAWMSKLCDGRYILVGQVTDIRTDLNGLVHRVQIDVGVADCDLGEEPFHTPPRTWAPAADPGGQDAHEVAPAHPPHMDGYYSRVAEIELPGEAVSVWLKHRAELAALPMPDREAAWKALCAKVEAVGKMHNAKVWLKKAILEEDNRQRRGS